MSDRVNSLLVILDKDMRDDDVQALVDAIRMMKNVNSVSMNVSDPDTQVAVMRSRVNNALLDLIKTGI